MCPLPREVCGYPSTTSPDQQPLIEPTPDDHELAARLAEKAGASLVALRDGDGYSFDPWSLRDVGDQHAHDLLVGELSRHRPFDIVLSEEGAEDRRRLDADRTWIIDPLDGTHDYPFRDSIEWAVHVAVVEDGRPTAAAVSVPGMEAVFGTSGGVQQRYRDGRGERSQPLVISGRSSGYLASRVAAGLDAEFTACGSAGVKTMLVLTGAADVYVHGSGLFEWDVCAPAAVAESAGLVVTDIDGAPIEYNKPDPVVRGLVVSRPDLATTVRELLDGLL